MIKFFRTIRQNMIRDNRVSKYILYAIGEIILVVIGILIALQINNWNENRKDLRTEQKILHQLKDEYQKNLAQLDEKIAMRNEMIYSSMRLLSFMDLNPTIGLDSILHHLSFIIRDPTFDPVENDLVVSGNLRLINNQNLQKRLSNWSSEVYQLQESELEWQKLRTSYMTPKIIELGLARDLSNYVWKDGYTPIHALDKSIKMTSKIGTSKKAPSVEEVLNSSELEGIAATQITWSNIGNLQSLALSKNILEILDLIETEIDD